MSLGEAFVEVRADLRPFGKDLKKALPPMVKAFERQLNQAVGRAMTQNAGTQGRDIGDRVGRGIKKSLTNQLKDKNIFLVLASSLAGALDDGISALPTEVKAAIVAGILAASPLVAGALSGLVAAALGVGLVGVGILLGSQFEQVQKRAVDFGRSLRNQLVESAKDFVPAIFQAFDMVETRVRRLRPTLDQVFNVSSNFLEPLTQGALDALQSLINIIFTQLDKLKPFIDELGAAIATLGDAIATSLGILVATGEDGQTALRDLVAIISIMLISVSSLIFVLTRLYGIFRDIIGVLADIVGPLTFTVGLIDYFFDVIDKGANKNKSFVNTNTEMAESFEAVIAATKGETDALEEYQKKLENVSKAAQSNLELNVAWEESLDRISESLEENGKTLDVHTEKGRNNINEFINGLKIAEERALLRVQRGEMTSQQAADQYQLEIDQLKKLATQSGLSEQAFNDLFNEIITTSQARISSGEMGVDELNEALGKAVIEAKSLNEQILMMRSFGKAAFEGAIGGIKGFADGGIQYLPTVAPIAEDGPEVIIPLTKPARAAQLMAQSGLASMLGGGGLSQVFVFVGNEALDSRMIRVAQRQTQAQAMALSQGGRTL